ncbi:succinylglutamate desuccinylase [Pseudoalteromonas luteoviolacea]|uniref:Succinylglutamate desuccinylase n=1 Tax=Pseudoalteromonas luteoviolacea NCIMB 1942 TaxID=1365253 RepID=A0A167H7D9_9GAMM|nr:succinylglutamate desuccinylase [Pseudoalteromonas luteoviolacea]KZN57715.1 succinylglutamate desuccinylase [Pseudoalteromonas luteoviolacea NCIMB 1942]KZW99913.1 succinylglutamate desuccinylase [Pseudoalteromonas luteoviolacea]
MYLDTLKTTGDFLTITRENEFSLEPSQFTLANGTEVKVIDTGVIEFTPKCKTSKDIVFSSAVHGNETAPIEICDELIQQIILGKLELKQRVLFIYGNPKSINIGQRFVDENLNRLFNGAHENRSENPEQVRAAKLEAYVRTFFTTVEEGRYRAHYDLHTAIRGSKNEKFAVYPFLHGKPWKKSQLQFLLSCGVNTVLMMSSAATTFSYFSSKQFGADAFTVELGQVKPFGQNNMASFEATRQTLKALISQEEVKYKRFNAEDFELFTVHRTINRTREDFSFPFPDSAVNFTGFAKGELLATDGENQIFAEVEGEAIIFPNAKVALGQRALLTVIPMEVNENFI